MEYQSVLVEDLLTSGQQSDDSPSGILESHRAGLNMLIRAAVTEVTKMSPAKLADIIRSSVYKAVDVMCTRAQDYVEKRYSRHHDLTMEMKREIQESFDTLSRDLKRNFEYATLKIENFILSKTYMMDHNLFQQGYIRFRHQEGVDYTDIESAEQLEAEVQKEEEELEMESRKVAQTRQELIEINSVSPALDESMNWIDTASDSGFPDAIEKVRLLMCELNSMQGLMETS